MKFFFFAALLYLFIQLPLPSYCQTRFMIAGGMDVIKTDFKKPFNKYQGGFELDYFLLQKISVNAGYEMWSETLNYYSVGARYYLFSFVFFKPRILFNEDNLNGSVALGYKYFINRRLGWESSIEYYFSSPELSVRTGISYAFTK